MTPTFWADLCLWVMALTWAHSLVRIWRIG